MNMGKVVRVVLLGEAFAVTTYALGWWTVPIVAGLWALFAKDLHRAFVAALCAAGGWATLLLIDVGRGPVGTMGVKLGGVLGVPALALWMLTLLFPALLAWSAVTIIPSFRASAPRASSS
jgi:hypothetical protein